MRTVIVVVNNNVYQVALTPPNATIGESVSMPDGRTFKRFKVKYRSNGQMIYFYKQVDTNAQ